MKIRILNWQSLVCMLLLAFPAQANDRSIHSFGDTIVLPVRWVSFHAFKKEDKVQLHWTTLHEQLTRQFVIERSQDGQHFIPIGQIRAAKDSYANAHYKYSDISPLDGLNFYRIRQVDENDDYSFSEIRKVNNYKPGSTLRILNNVVSNGQLRVKVSSVKGSPLKAAIYSNYGMLINSRAVSQGDQLIDVSNLHSGTYFLHIGQEVKNFVIL